MTTWEYAVTFEFENDPPITLRGTVEAELRHTAASRAVYEAGKTRPRTKPASLVVLLQEGVQ